jgi:hypothetical protein
MLRLSDEITAVLRNAPYNMSPRMILVVLLLLYTSCNDFWATAVHRHGIFFPRLIILHNLWEYDVFVLLLLTKTGAHSRVFRHPRKWTIQQE